jgi:hypothetical protein
VRRAGVLEDVEAEALYRHLGALEDLVASTLRAPPDLLGEVKRRLEASPALGAELARILEAYPQEGS